MMWKWKWKILRIRTFAVLQYFKQKLLLQNLVIFWAVMRQKCSHLYMYNIYIYVKCFKNLVKIALLLCKYPVVIYTWDKSCFSGPYEYSVIYIYI